MEDLGHCARIDGSGGLHAVSALQGDLLKAAHGQATLREALVTLPLYQQELTSAAAELSEREAWATMALLEASSGVWDQFASPTLRFALSGDGHTPCHLELGRFAHLEALNSPSEGEQALMAAVVPCWARVVPHRERELAGYVGPLACAYEPIPLAEAVSILGFNTILSRLQDAAVAASQALLVEDQAQRLRRERLVHVEQMLGWQPDPAVQDEPLPGHTRVLLALLRPGRGWLLASALLGLFAVALGSLAGLSYAALAILPAALSLVIGLCALER